MVVRAGVPRLIGRFRKVASNHPSVSASLHEVGIDSLTFQVDVDRVLPIGMARGSISFDFDDRAYPSLIVPFVGLKTGDFEVVPSTISRIDLAAGARRRIRIASRTGRDFRIVGVHCPKGVKIEPAVDNFPAVRHFVIVSTTGAGAPAEGRILIETDSLEAKTIVLPVVSDAVGS